MLSNEVDDVALLSHIRSSVSGKVPAVSSESIVLPVYRSIIHCSAVGWSLIGPRLAASVVLVPCQSFRVGRDLVLELQDSPWGSDLVTERT